MLSCKGQGHQQVKDTMSYYFSLTEHRFCEKTHKVFVLRV